MRIGEVAGAAGVNVQTLRYYERRGLLPAPPRTASGYRTYSAEAARIVRFIKRAQTLGFTLSEVEDLLRLRNLSGRQRAELRDRAAVKIRDIDTKIRELRAVRRGLATLVDSCGCARSDAECPILGALSGPEPRSLKENSSGNA